MCLEKGSDQLIETLYAYLSTLLYTTSLFEPFSRHALYLNPYGLVPRDKNIFICSLNKIEHCRSRKDFLLKSVLLIFHAVGQVS